MKSIDKVWGYELEIVNTPDYCGKILVVNQGYRCSIHQHKIKDETFYINKGIVLVEWENDGTRFEKIMYKTEGIRIFPNMPHRFTGIAPISEIIEFSTHHEDNDSIRSTKSEELPIEEANRLFFKLANELALKTYKCDGGCCQ